MRLKKLSIISVDGIARPFSISAGPGLNLVYGGNASGKSTIARLVHDSLFHEGAGLRGEADLDWLLEGEDATAETHRLRPLGGEPHPFAARRPSSDQAACYLLRAADLLSVDAPDDQEIARRLRREMAGGIDLPALREAARVSSPQKDLQNLRKAIEALREIEGRQAALAQDEESLVQLQARIEEAAAARARLLLLAARERMIAHEDAREPKRRQFEAMEPEVGRVPASAAALRKDRIDNLARAAEGLASARREAERLDDQIRAAGPDRRPFDAAELDRLESLLTRIPVLQKDQDAAQRRAQEASAQLHGREDLLALHEKDPGDEIFGVLARLIEEADERRNELAAVEARREKLLADRINEGESGEELRAGLEALDRWTAAQADDESAIRTRIISALLLATVGAASHFVFGLPLVIAVGGLGLGLLIAEWNALGRRRRLLAEAEADYRNADTALDVDFEANAVRKARKTLRERAAAAEWTLLKQNARAELEAEINRLRQGNDEVRTELEAELSRQGIDPDENLPLASVLHLERVVQLRRRQAERAAAEALRETIDEELDRLRDEGRALAAAVGGALADDLDDLVPGLLRLRAEHDRLEDLLDRRDEHQRRVVEGEREVAAAEQALGEFHAPLGIAVDDDGGFRALVEAAALRDRLRESLGRFAALIDAEQARLREHPEILALDAAALEEELRRDEALSSTLEDLHERVTKIRTRIEDALEGRSLGQAVAERDRAREVLESRREEALGAELRLALLDRLADDVEHRVESQVLEESRKLFARFTRNAWSLEVLNERLAARESASGGIRPLDKLSDGTRVQLLMAARIAFLASIEQDEKIPLLLDEVLASADPTRFAAIAEVLLQEAAQGRQIFYFTADPHDLAFLERLAERSDKAELVIIDLAKARGEAGIDWRNARRDLREVPTPPRIEDCDPADQAEALGLGQPDWRRPVGELHLYHLLFDRLPLLQRLLDSGISNLGSWRAARRSGSARLIVTEGAELDRLDALGRAAERVIECMALGRGRPMSAADLEPDFGTKKSVFGPMCLLLEREGGDAARLIAAIEDKEIPGFGSTYTAKLREVAEAGGFLPDGKALGPEQLLHEGLGSVTAEVEAGSVGAEDLMQVLRRLLADLGAT